MPEPVCHKRDNFVDTATKGTYVIASFHPIRCRYNNGTSKQLFEFSNIISVVFKVLILIEPLRLDKSLFEFK